MPPPGPCRGTRSPLPSRTRISASRGLSFPMSGTFALHVSLLVGRRPAVEAEIAEGLYDLAQGGPPRDARGDQGHRVEVRLDVPALVEEPLQSPAGRWRGDEPRGQHRLHRAPARG